MAYEVFDRTSRPTGNPIVSVLPNGGVALNAAASRLLREAGAVAALFLWDRSKRQLALKACRKDDPNAFAVTFHRASATVGGKTFFDYIGWTGKRREGLPAIWNAKERMFEVAIPARLIDEKAQPSKGLK